MDSQYFVEAKRIAEEYGIPYPLTDESVEDLLINCYNSMRRILRIQLDTTKRIYLENRDKVRCDKYHCIFDGEIHGPFDTEKESFSYIKKNARYFPIQPLTFRGNIVEEIV